MKWLTEVVKFLANITCRRNTTAKLNFFCVRIFVIAQSISNLFAVEEKISFVIYGIGLLIPSRRDFVDRILSLTFVIPK